MIDRRRRRSNERGAAKTAPNGPTTVWVSLPMNPTIVFDESATEGVSVTVERRPSDWGLRGLRHAFAMVRVCTSLARRARTYDAVVVCTAGWELPLLAALFAGFRIPRVVVYDYLIPRSSRLDRLLAFAFRAVDHFACCRRGDLATLERRFAIEPARASFVRFPAPIDTPAVVGSGIDVDVYSAGQAHRDVDSVVAVLERVDVTAVVSLRDPSAVDHLRPRVLALPLLSPEDGRKHLGSSRISLQLYLPTELPAGPLLLLDAMAAGKAIVVTDVNGTRDYVTDGEDALVVPPRDVEVAVRALERLRADPELRDRLGRSARERALGYSQASFVVDLLSLALPEGNRKAQIRSEG